MYTRRGKNLLTGQKNKGNKRALWKTPTQLDDPLPFKITYTHLLTGYRNSINIDVYIILKGKGLSNWFSPGDSRFRSFCFLYCLVTTSERFKARCEHFWISVETYHSHRKQDMSSGLLGICRLLPSTIINYIVVLIVNRSCISTIFTISPVCYVLMLHWI